MAWTDSLTTYWYWEIGEQREEASFKKKANYSSVNRSGVSKILSVLAASKSLTPMENYRYKCLKNMKTKLKLQTYTLVVI